jgi:hypothetical protein
VLEGGVVTPPLSSLTETLFSASVPVLQTLPENITSTPVPPAFTAAAQVLSTVISEGTGTEQMAVASACSV